MGCGVILTKFLNEEKKQKTHPLSYKAILLSNPFLNSHDKNYYYIKPIIKALYKYKKDYLIPYAKIDNIVIPDHKYHWEFDEENPFQKKMYPLHTFIEFNKHTNYFIKLIDEANNVEIKNFNNWLDGISHQQT